MRTANAMHGWCISFTRADGHRAAVSVMGCATAEEAFLQALEQARLIGWAPPRWWQWWRWHEPIRSSRSFPGMGAPGWTCDYHPPT